MDNASDSPAFRLFRFQHELRFPVRKPQTGLRFLISLKGKNDFSCRKLRGQRMFIGIVKNPADFIIVSLFCQPCQIPIVKFRTLRPRSRRRVPDVRPVQTEPQMPGTAPYQASRLPVSKGKGALPAGNIFLKSQFMLHTFRSSPFLPCSGPRSQTARRFLLLDGCRTQLRFPTVLRPHP